jgi:hypothetical protein
MEAPNDDLSPSEFLQKISELGQKRDSEDAQRVAALESQIQKDRELRAIRRAGELTI